MSTTRTRFTATPLDFTEDQLAQIQYNDDGLVGAIVQDASDGAVLMFAWMNAASLRQTLETGRTWFWSRSRQEFWCKGETSGNRQYVRSVHYDCDGDTLLITVDQEGVGACHTGNRSCFYRAFGPDSTQDVQDSSLHSAISLHSVTSLRSPSDPGPSPLDPGRGPGDR